MASQGLELALSVDPLPKVITFDFVRFDALRPDRTGLSALLGV